MTEPFIGQIQTFGFGFPPRGWAFCDGQIMSIAQNTALFSLIGTTFGGNGQTTFSLPDLRGRSAIHPGSGPGLSNISWGQVGGAESVTLITTNLPAQSHTHTVAMKASTVDGDVVAQTGAYLAKGISSGSGPNKSTLKAFTTNGTTTVDLAAPTVNTFTTSNQNSAPFGIRSPYLAIYHSIALEGIFPSRN
ncbi:Phage Tail Collar Domain protein [compost metagenome]